MNRDNIRTRLTILRGCQEVAYRALKDYSLSFSKDF